MPTYDYVCQACDRRLEVMHGVHAEGPTSCEVCGGRLRKALSTPAIVFKGSGWAKVDARARASKASSTEKAAASDSGDGAGKASESSQSSADKPAAAPAAGGTGAGGSASSSTGPAD